MTAFVPDEMKKKEINQEEHTCERNTSFYYAFVMIWFIHVLDAFWSDALELVIPKSTDRSYVCLVFVCLYVFVLNFLIEFDSFLWNFYQIWVMDYPFFRISLINDVSNQRTCILFKNRKLNYCNHTNNHNKNGDIQKKRYLYSSIFIYFICFKTRKLIELISRIYRILYIYLVSLLFFLYIMGNGLPIFQNLIN